MTSSWRYNRRYTFLKLHFVKEETGVLLKQNPAPNLQTFQLFGVYNDVTAIAKLPNFFSAFSQKLITVETPLTTFL